MDLSEETCRLWLGGLAKQVREIHIVQLCKPLEGFCDLHFPYFAQGTQKGQPRGFCFIKFKTAEATAKAYKILQKKVLFSRPIIVRPANEHDPSSSAKRSFDRSTATGIKYNDTSKLSAETKVKMIERKLKRAKP